MRVLFYRYNSICEPDYISGFRECGFDVDEITAEMVDKSVTQADTVKIVSDVLLKKSYDFVFSINFYPAISAVCELFKVRYLCHTVDSPVFELYSKEVRNSWNRIFVFDMDQYRTFEPVNPGHIFHLPLATNPARWDGVVGGASDADKRKFASDVSFVGSLYTEKCPYDDLDSDDEYFLGFLDGIMNAQMRIFGAHFLAEFVTDDMVEKFKAQTKNFFHPEEYEMLSDKESMLRNYLDAKISVMERLEVMRVLGEKFDVDLYTRSDAGGLPVRDRGGCQTLTEMPIIFNQSKINLNITMKAIREGLSLRIFDVLGCGGFLITNYQAELADIFTLGEDLEVYTSIDELANKVEYYLEHEKEREEIARNGNAKVREFHNYPLRISQMIEMAFE